MSILVNHNLPALRAANDLAGHYQNLAISTRRLSTGQRINGAADDAAGLAIRELMRADIAALQQGARNVNDAISMIQTFDGALGVIDEKLIRMKELAEQAATGTYSSTQRLMIDSEFQAMGSEINRIARATDFNGIKLLNGNTSNTINTITVFGANVRTIQPGSDGKDYDVTTSGTTVSGFGTGAAATQIGGWDTSGIADPSKLAASQNITLTNTNLPTIGGKYIVFTGTIPANQSINVSFDPKNGWTVNGDDEASGIVAGFKNDVGFSYQKGALNFSGRVYNTDGSVASMTTAASMAAPFIYGSAPVLTSSTGTIQNAAMNGETFTFDLDLGNNNIVSGTFNVPGGDTFTLRSIKFALNSRDTTTNPPGPNPPTPGIPDDFTDKVKIHFGTLNSSAEDYYYINKHDATLTGLGLEDVDIKTQDNAQKALNKITDAIVEKDKIRAEYGATQNRFENTLSNIRLQAENLQVSESRISDADIALEMMNFVRHQILTQSALAMLSQANSMPQMVMRLVN